MDLTRSPLVVENPVLMTSARVSRLLVWMTRVPQRSVCRSWVCTRCNQWPWLTSSSCTLWWKARLGGCWGRLLLVTGTLSPVSELSSTMAVPCSITASQGSSPVSGTTTTSPGTSEEEGTVSLQDTAAVETVAGVCSSHLTSPASLVTGWLLETVLRRLRWLRLVWYSAVPSDTTEVREIARA